MVPKCPYCKSKEYVSELDDGITIEARIKNKNPPYNKITITCSKGFQCSKCKNIYLDSDDFAENIAVYKMISGDENFEPSLEEVKNSETIPEKIEAFMSEMWYEDAP